MALWRLTATALRSWDTLAGGRARLQAGTGLQSERNKSPSSGILRPLGEKLAFPQWWALKPFYLAIKAKETSEGFGHARSCRIRLFSVWPSRGSPACSHAILKFGVDALRGFSPLSPAPVAISLWVSSIFFCLAHILIH